MDRLGVLGLIERWVRTGSANPGRKILTVVAAMLAGGTHIDHVAMLRAGRTERVLGFGYWANCAWLACATLAHNIGHWTAALAGSPPATNRSRRTRRFRVRAACSLGLLGRPLVGSQRRWIPRCDGTP